MPQVIGDALRGLYLSGTVSAELAFVNETIGLSSSTDVTGNLHLQGASMGAECQISEFSAQIQIAEKSCFDEGDVPLQVNEVRGMRVGMMVCFDWAFPEVARALTLKGADLIGHPANLVLTYCQQAMVTRCIENLVFAVTANRYGTEERPHGELTFTGQSQIVAPKGALVHRSRPDRDDLYVAPVDISLARDKKIAERNDVIADRRPEFYRELCARPQEA